MFILKQYVLYVNITFCFKIKFLRGNIMNRLKEMREDRDILQSEISKVLNVSQVAYSYYEIGKRQLPIDILVKLAKYYKTSTDYLLYLTDEKKPYPKSAISNDNK